MVEEKFSKKKFDCICSNCGEETQVPFKPDGKRPVYCQDCLRKNKARTDNRNSKKFGGKKMVYEEEDEEDWDSD